MKFGETFWLFYDNYVANQLISLSVTSFNWRNYTTSQDSIPVDYIHDVFFSNLFSLVNFAFSYKKFIDKWSLNPCWFAGREVNSTSEIKDAFKHRVSLHVYKCAETGVGSPVTRSHECKF